MARTSSVWWGAAGVFVALFALLGYRSARPDSLNAGLETGVATALIVFAFHRLRKRETHSGPDAEYLVSVWAAAYVVLVGFTAVRRSVDLVDSLVLYLPLGAVPLAARVLKGDTGDPTGPARRLARGLHRFLGWMHVAIGGLFVVSLFYLFVSPVQLIPGVLHLWAAFEYGRKQAGLQSR